MLRKRRNEGFSLIELMIVLAIILIIAGIAVSEGGKQLALAHETSAIQNLRTVHTMQIQYYSQFGHFAAQLSELGPPPSGAGLIPKSLAEGKKSGYIFSMQLTGDGYSVTAVPERFGTGGRRTFYSDQSQTVRQNWSRDPADMNSPEI
jgi:type IV pilus assembly protein PilA